MQEDFTVTTPVTGAVVVLRGYITGRIKQKLEAVFYNNTEATKDGLSKFNPNAIIEATNCALESIVVSINGKTDGILDAILDLPEADYDFVTDEVNKVRTPLVPMTTSESKTATSTP